LLQRTSPKGRPFESARRQFVLALRDAHGEQIQDQTNCADVANLRAPESVNTIQLVSVLISLRFEALRTENGSSVSTNKPLEPSVATFLSIGENQLQDDQTTNEECSQGFESLLANDDFGPWSPLLDFDSPPEFTAKKLKSKRQSVSMPILPLADIAIRSLICPRPMRSPAASLSCEENSFFNLANLAPAVFIPGYRQAVQSRAKFIPTIAKSLCQFLQHSGPKVHFAHNANESKASGIEHSAEEYSPEQKDNIKRHLWMTLTNGVKNVDLARKLKPLHMARADGVQVLPSRTFEDLLDTWRHCEDDAVFPFKDDFEDLHLNEEQDFAESEDEYFSDLHDEFLLTSETGNVNVTNATPVHFHDKISEVISSLPLPDRTLNATSWPERTFACEHQAATACPESRTSRGLQTKLDSSNSQLKEATQGYSLTSQPNMIGENGLSHDYVSRKLPSHSFEDEDGDSSRAETLILEQFELRAASSISPILEQSAPFEAQDIIDVDDHQSHHLLDILDHDIKMTSREKYNRSSLADVIGGDQLLWQMWTRRRPSMMQTDDDMLEMHTMYAQDPDMRLLDTHKEHDDKGDDYMLDSEPSNASSIDSSSSTNRQQDFIFPCGPSPVAERKHHHPFHLHKDPSPTPSQSDSSRPTSRRRLSRGQSFIKRLSGSRASVEEASSPSRPFSRDTPRDVEIKRRKTLADYDKLSDGDEMLLR
jgi:hypothetical protein